MNPTVTLTHDATGEPMTFISANIGTIMVARNGQTLVKLMNGCGYYVTETVEVATNRLNGSVY